MSVDREDLENVFMQSFDNFKSPEAGNVADALFYIGEALFGIRDEMKKRNVIYEEEVFKKSRESWMEK